MMKLTPLPIESAQRLAVEYPRTHDALRVHHSHDDVFRRRIKLSEPLADDLLRHVWEHLRRCHATLKAPASTSKTLKRIIVVTMSHCSILEQVAIIVPKHANKSWLDIEGSYHERNSRTHACHTAINVNPNILWALMSQVIQVILDQCATHWSTVVTYQFGIDISQDRTGRAFENETALQQMRIQALKSVPQYGYHVDAWWLHPPHDEPHDEPLPCNWCCMLLPSERKIGDRFSPCKALKLRLVSNVATTPMCVDYGTHVSDWNIEQERTTADAMLWHFPTDTEHSSGPLSALKHWEALRCIFAEQQRCEATSPIFLLDDDTEVVVIDQVDVLATHGRLVGRPLQTMLHCIMNDMESKLRNGLFPYRLDECTINSRGHSGGWYISPGWMVRMPETDEDKLRLATALRALAKSEPSQFMLPQAWLEQDGDEDLTAENVDVVMHRALKMQFLALCLRFTTGRFQCRVSPHSSIQDMMASMTNIGGMWRSLILQLHKCTFTDQKLNTFRHYAIYEDYMTALDLAEWREAVVHVPYDELVERVNEQSLLINALLKSLGLQADGSEIPRLKPVPGH